MPNNYVFQLKNNFLEMAHTNLVSSIRQRANPAPSLHKKVFKIMFSTFQNFENNKN